MSDQLPVVQRWSYTPDQVLEGSDHGAWVQHKDYQKLQEIAEAALAEANEFKGYAAIGRGGACVHSKFEVDCISCRVRVLNYRLQETRQFLTTALPVLEQLVAAEAVLEVDEQGIKLSGEPRAVKAAEQLVELRKLLNGLNKLSEQTLLAENAEPRTSPPSDLELAAGTLQQFRESGFRHFLDNADADILREMVALAVFPEDN